MSTIKLKLTSYNMGPYATEADFDSWAAYVANHINEALGLEVEVDQHRFGGGPDVDTIRDADDGELEAIREWLAVEAWNAYCDS